MIKKVMIQLRAKTSKKQQGGGVGGGGSSSPFMMIEVKVAGGFGGADPP